MAIEMSKSSLLRSTLFLAATTLATGFAAIGNADATEIDIPTFTPASYAAILDGSYTSSKDTISGKLTLPANSGSTQVPAVILLHGSGGVRDEIELTVAKALNDAGIATLVVDSFSGRGLSSTGKDQGKLTMAASVIDGLQALKALKSHPGIDPNRIGVTGFSRGGVAALFAGQKPLADAVLTDGSTFAALAPVYPGCATQWDKVQPVSAQMHFFLGEKDDLTPATRCVDYAAKIKAAGGKADTTIYPGASHQFLIAKQSKVSGAANFADCSMGIRDNGTTYHSATGTDDSSGWVSFVRGVFKNCGKKGFTRGSSEDVRKRAIEDITSFFARSLG